MFSVRNSWLVAAGTLAISGALYAVYAFDPSTTSFFPHCVFHDLTGLNCPGCGGTRALHALLHGHVVDALRFNALLVIGGPFLAFAAAGEIVHPLPILRRPWVGWTAVIALIGWGVLRNVI